MQIGTPPPRSSTIVTIRPPVDAKPGDPMTDSVLLTTTRPATRFPGSGIGLGSWALVMRASWEDALAGAKYMSELKGRPLALFQYRPFGWSQDAYGAAPLEQLDWVAGGYGGSFRSTPITHLDAEHLFAIKGKAGGLRVLTVVDRDRVIPTTTVRPGVPA